MKKHPHNRPISPAVAIAALGLGLLLAPAETAQATERFKLRALASGLFPSSDEILVGSGAGPNARFSLADGSAVALELEFEWRPRIAFELMMSFGEYDAELAAVSGGSPARADLGTETYTLGVNYLLAHVGKAELWAGAFGGFSYYDDVTLVDATGRPEVFRFDDDLGFGAKIGLDLPLGGTSPWLANVALRYQSSILEGEVAGQDMDVDPLFVTVGVGYRF